MPLRHSQSGDLQREVVRIQRNRSGQGLAKFLLNQPAMQREMVKISLICLREKMELLNWPQFVAGRVRLGLMSNDTMISQPTRVF